MTEPTPTAPLVTFALFACNQERYIREAVEGAFSQRYSPLGTILSIEASYLPVRQTLVMLNAPSIDNYLCYDQLSDSELAPLENTA